MRTHIDRKWVRNAVEAIHADFQRSADTNLIKFKLPEQFEDGGLALYLKDESIHPTGSLKHRLARSLFLYALCNGYIPNAETKVFEASSGSTAISEAYFARLIGLKAFFAVVPKGTSSDKIKLITDYGGNVEETTEDIVKRAAEMATAAKGHFMDQFTNSERATDWRGNNNIAKTIFQQMSKERGPDGLKIKGGLIPKWIVIGAGTGGTSATIGRYVRFKGFETRVCVVDPRGESALFDTWSEARGRNNPKTKVFKDAKSVIEGIGRPYSPVSFLPEVIDAMISVPNDASIGAMRYLHETGRHYHGASTGTNLFGASVVLQRMLKGPKEDRGAVVTLLCDSGLRYKTTYYLERDTLEIGEETWLEKQRCNDQGSVFHEGQIEKFKLAISDFLDAGKNRKLTQIRNAPGLPAMNGRDCVLEDFAF